MNANGPSFGTVSPPPTDRRRFDWGGGVFETARRALTAEVEGVLTPSEPILMATLRGGAQHHEVATDDGYRHSGPDVAGSISFLPGGCSRRLRLKNVQWQWASVTLPATATPDSTASSAQPFNAVRDDVVLGILTELERLHALDNRLDVTYCDAMSLALNQYLARRYWGAGPFDDRRPASLPAWKVRRVSDYVEAHLADEIRIATLAALVGLSEGHFQRAFRATTGQTPLAFTTHRRTEAAKRLLVSGGESVAVIAPLVGFVSQSHFARTFRAATGLTPREYRMKFGLE